MWKRWRLLNATDFQSLMCPCFTFCRIFGIFPYKINISTFKCSRPCYILSTIITCFSCVYVIVHINNILLSGGISYGDVTMNLNAVTYFALSGLMIIIMYILIIPRMQVLQTILRISSKLIPSKSYQQLSRLIHVKDILGTILTIIEMFLFFSKTNMFKFTFSNILLILFAIYLEMVIFLTNMLYVNCVCVLKTCFKSINDKLTYLQRIVVDDIKSISVYKLFCQGNLFLLLEIRTLKKQHLIVSETVHMLNMIFGLQLIIIISQIFINVTFELYTYVVRWQHGLLITLDWQFLDVFSTSMIHYLSKIILLAWACESNKNQAKEIGVTLHEILNSTTDKEIKNEVIKLFKKIYTSLLSRHVVFECNLYVCNIYFCVKKEILI
ncbi:uncharacterized protein [Cardiocondyla obscurior]|uniref:uncharacterized protein n=1 Tax=Cardiocondyla obscurior TaxID=286306 RepID=UPI0039655E3C